VNSNNFIETPTDGSAEGLILCFSFPQAGFAPVMLKEMESLSHKASGVIIAHIAQTSRGKALREFYKDHQIALIEGVDTRELALHLSAKPLLGELYSGNNFGVDTCEMENSRLPNSGKTLAVLGELPNSLLKDLVGLGYELVQYQDRLPEAFNQIDGILVIRNLEKIEMEKLIATEIPIIALTLAAQSFTNFYGGELEEKALFSQNLVLEDLTLAQSKTLIAEFRLSKTIKKAPGRVLFVEHYTKRPVGFTKDNVLCLEFLPGKTILDDLCERGWTTL
ncbi:MAG: carbamoyl-phosphate synthase domain-containing protein, partial [Bacillota bacterium]